MQVNKLAGEAARPDVVQRPAQPPSPLPAAESGGAGTARGDQVEISEAGRVLAGAAGAPGPSAPDESGRADEVRSRILSGAYDSLAMADQVARAILRSGDL